MVYEGRFTEGLSLVDAVMPDVVIAKQQQLHEKMLAEKLKKEKLEKADDGNVVNSVSTNDSCQTVTTVTDTSATNNNSVTSSYNTPTVPTSTTLTANIKQESPQTNGQHSVLGKKLLFFSITMSQDTQQVTSYISLCCC